MRLREWPGISDETNVAMFLFYRSTTRCLSQLLVFVQITYHVNRHNKETRFFENFLFHLGILFVFICLCFFFVNNRFISVHASIIIVRRRIRVINLAVLHTFFFVPTVGILCRQFFPLIATIPFEIPTCNFSTSGGDEIVERCDAAVNLVIVLSEFFPFPHANGDERFEIASANSVCCQFSLSRTLNISPSSHT